MSSFTDNQWGQMPATDAPHATPMASSRPKRAAAMKAAERMKVPLPSFKIEKGDGVGGEGKGVLERELTRGLLVSPEKEKRWGRSKYIRYVSEFDLTSAFRIVFPASQCRPSVLSHVLRILV